MARYTGAQVLAKWKQRLDASTEYIKQGVSRVTVAPGQAAAAAADRMVAGVQASVSSGQWQRRVSSVSLQDWQNAVINKGIPRIPAGTAQAVATKAPVFDALLAAVDTAKAAANALPRGGLEQGISRANAYMRAMSAAAPKKRGG